MLVKNKSISTFIFSVFLFTQISAQITYEPAFPNINFEFPVELQSSVDSTNRMFVVEQPGRIKVFPNSIDVTQGDVNLFLDITDQVRYSAGQELGLLGLAFHLQDRTRTMRPQVHHTFL